MQILLQTLRWLLWPIAVLYNGITRLRNHLYNIGVKPSVQFDLPTIVVGNLAVGGTGKTPHIEYLIRLLKDRYAIATLSRGYGRQTKGPIIADDTATAAIIGDEPMQFYAKFGNSVPVMVGEDRVWAIPQLLEAFPATQAILLDDAYQHRKLQASFQILLTDYHRPFYTDFVLPTGNLREARIGAKRADLVIVSKCPSALSMQAQSLIKAQIAHYTQAPIFFSSISYGQPIIMGHKPWSKKFVAVTGIAQANPFIDYLQTQGEIAAHFEFADHHSYTEKDIIQVLEAAASHGNACIVMTEKDAVKWQAYNLMAIWEKEAVYHLPIEISFIGEENAFQQLVLSHLASFEAEIEG